MALRIWPARIRVEEDGIGANRVAVTDGDTGERLMAVLALSIEHPYSMLSVTMSKYDPHEFAVDHPDDQEQDGIAVEKREYPVRKLHIEAGS